MGRPKAFIFFLEIMLGGHICNLGKGGPPYVIFNTFYKKLKTISFSLVLFGVFVWGFGVPFFLHKRKNCYGHFRISVPPYTLILSMYVVEHHIFKKFYNMPLIYYRQKFWSAKVRSCVI